MSDGVHKSAGYHDAGLSASVSANERIRICTFHSVINLQESFFSVQILGECLRLRATYTSTYVTTYVGIYSYIVCFLKTTVDKISTEIQIGSLSRN